MGKHNAAREPDYNTAPFNESASPQRKAREFDRQVAQNQRNASSQTPALDEYNAKKGNER